MDSHRLHIRRVAAAQIGRRIFSSATACHNIYANPRWKSSRAIGMSETNKCQTGHINKIECHATLLNIFWQFILFLFSRCLLYIITVWRVFGERVASSRVQQCKNKKQKKNGRKIKFLFMCCHIFYALVPTRLISFFHFFCFCFLCLFIFLFFWAALFTLLIYVRR